MSDRKYGRLFTEADMKRLIGTALSYRELIGLDAVIDLTVSEGEPLTFPEDEPLFLLRGQDANALAAVDEYERSMLRFASEPSYDSHMRGVEAARRAFEDWQREHPDRVKVPD